MVAEHNLGLLTKLLLLLKLSESVKLTISNPSGRTYFLFLVIPVMTDITNVKT